MRGADVRTGELFSYVDLEKRVREDHPLRAIRAIVNATLAALGQEFARLYAPIGRPSIPPEKLLRAMLLQVFYSIRSERQLMERLEFDLLFRLCEEIDGRVKAFLERPIEGDWPYLWIDATYVKVRQAGRIVSVAVIVAVGVNSDGRREVLGLEIGPSEAETFWTAFLRKLARRGLRGVKLVISDAHEGIKAAVTKVLSTSWQRCRVHFMRNVLAHAGRQGRRVVSAFIATAFAQNSAEAAKRQWRLVADQIRPKVPKLASLMDEAETDVLAYMTFPVQHRAKLHSTNPLERVSGRAECHPPGLASALLTLERRQGRLWEGLLLPGSRLPDPWLLRTHPPTEARVERLISLTPAPHRPINFPAAWDEFAATAPPLRAPRFHWQRLGTWD